MLLGHPLVIGILTLSALAGFVGFAVSERSGGWFVGEDGVVEWASAALFTAAAGLAMAMVRLQALRGADRWLLVFVAVLGLACMLSELSFGARIGQFSMPAMPGGGEIDGAQDFVMMAKRAAPGHPVVKLAVLLVTGAIAMAIAFRLGLFHFLREWMADNRRRQWVLIAIAALGFAVLIDTFEQRWTMPFEELTELFAAGALLASTLSGGQNAQRHAAISRHGHKLQP